MIGATANLAEVRLSWDAAPLGEYQVQYSDALGDWIDSPSGFFAAGVTGASFVWTDDGPPATDAPPGGESKRFYRIVRFQ